MKDQNLIINVCLTGVVPTKDVNPHVPISPKEIAQDARKVYDLGASMVHIHARDKDGQPSSKKEIYKEIIERIRDKCEDLVIVVSTSGRRMRDIRQRMNVLELDGYHKPDMASLTLGSMNFKDDTGINSPETILSLLATMSSSGIRPELEIFDTGMANYAKYLFEKGYLEGRHYSNLILGSLGTMPATPKNLCHLVDELHENLLWAATGVGRFAFRMQCLSLAMGGHIRVGVEDSIFMDEAKTQVATNENLVSRIVRVAEAMGRRLGTPGDVRKMLQL
jgi:uncharacterized protein (DUF849 family)